MTSPIDLAAQRREYSAQELSEAEVSLDPIVQLQRWLDESVTAGVTDATAMCLTTVSKAGAPSSRVVLLKKLDERGLVFFTRTSSQKGHEIESNPQVSLLFHWRELNRQVRISGRATPTSTEENWEYFRTRPRNSRLAARVASHRTTVADRHTLEELFTAEDRAHPGDDIPIPDDWGGYLVRPSEFEFWQGRESRLHDRLLYTPAESGWLIRRLAP
jgi:pyridoxamine 5'-phosphate oxidase